MNRKIIIQDEAGQSVYELLDEVTIIGRDPACEVVVEGHKVSRRHTRLTCVDGQLVVEDLESRNGTTVNGEPLVGKMILDAGDELTVGDVEIFIDRAPAFVAAAGAAPPSSRRAAGDRKSRNNAVLIVIAVFAVAAAFFYLKRQGAQPAPQPAATTATAPTGGAAPTTRVGSSEEPAAIPAADQADLVRLKARARALERVRLDVEQLLVQEAFPDALAAISTFELQHGGVSARLRESVREAMDASAAGIARQFHTYVAEGKRPLALAYVGERLALYPEHSDAHARLRELLNERSDAAPVSVASPGGGDTAGESPAATRPTTTPAPAPALSAAGKAEREAARGRFFTETGQADEEYVCRRFADAAQRYEELAALGRVAGIESELVQVVGRKARLARAFAEFQIALGDRIRSAPEAFVQIPCMPGRRGDVVDATADTISFKIGEETVELGWKVLRADALKGLVQTAGLAGRAKAQAAAFLLTVGEQALAHKMMRQVEEASPADKPVIDQILADASGVERPDEGFVWHEGEYITPRTLERIQVRATIESNLALLQSPKAAVRAQAYEAFSALGSRAVSAYHRGLVDAKSAALARLQKLPSHKKLEGLGNLKTELDRARTHALELIFDTEKYPYPYRGLGQQVASLYAETQAEIERRVKVVEDLWENPTKVAISPELREGIALVQEYNAHLDRLDLGRGPAEDRSLLFLPVGEVATVQIFALSEEERRDVDTSLEWVRLNETAQSVANLGEKTELRLTNEYRMMMGRHAVRGHDKLTLVARGHSSDMSRLGFFAHFNDKEPQKRTPRDRAVLGGFYGVGISENIARTGGAESAHSGWLHSSGHHRNILGRSWRLLGVGNDGSNWTQNFSIREYTEDERKASGRAIEGDDGTPD